MKQIEEEYYKSDEKTTQQPQATNTAATTTPHDLYPPSPDQPLSSMAQHVPEPVKEAVNSLIRSHVTAPHQTNITIIPDTQKVPTYSSKVNL